MEAEVGRERRRLLGRARCHRAQAEISGRSGNQQLPVLETADGMRARLLHLGIRRSLVDAKTPAIVTANGGMGCSGDLRDRRWDTAWNRRGKNAA